jgi:hypothetical protein
LAKRFQQFANSFFIGFRRCAPDWRRRSCRSSCSACLILAGLARCAGQQLEQKRDCDEQKEKQIFEISGNHGYRLVKS